MIFGGYGATLLFGENATLCMVSPLIRGILISHIGLHIINSPNLGHINLFLSILSCLCYFFVVLDRGHYEEAFDRALYVLDENKPFCI